MTGDTDPTPPQYVAARLTKALAEDPRTTEQGVRVIVRGNQVMVSGAVATDHRRSQVDEVLREAAPDMVVHNDIRVVCADAPTGREELR